MTNLNQALDRLSRAVERLDGSARQCVERSDDEKHRLTAELKILHAEYAGLSGLTERVSKELDDTISRLAQVLETQSDDGEAAR